MRVIKKKKDDILEFLIMKRRQVGMVELSVLKKTWFGIMNVEMNRTRVILNLKEIKDSLLTKFLSQIDKTQMKYFSRISFNDDEMIEKFKEMLMSFFIRNNSNDESPKIIVERKEEDNNLVEFLFSKSVNLSLLEEKIEIFFKKIINEMKDILDSLING